MSVRAVAVSGVRGSVPFRNRFNALQGFVYCYDIEDRGRGSVLWLDDSDLLQGNLIWPGFSLYYDLIRSGLPVALHQSQFMAREQDSHLLREFNQAKCIDNSIKQHSRTDLGLILKQLE
jgi:hypothetical protein